MTVRAFGGADHFVQQNTLRTNRSQKPYCEGQHGITTDFHLTPSSSADLMNVSRRWLNTALNICATGEFLEV